MGTGDYEIAFLRGPEGKGESRGDKVENSSLYAMLQSLEISHTATEELLATCTTPMIQEWIQITLAAKSAGRISQSPAAYFLYHIRRARDGKQLAPDWWEELRREEDQQRWDKSGKLLRSHLAKQAEQHDMDIPTFQEYLRSREAQDAFKSVCRELRQSCQDEQTVKTLGMNRMRTLYRDDFPHDENGTSHVVTDWLDGNQG